MRKIKVGDIFSIETPKGLCLFQYVYLEETLGELIYIFSGLHEKIPQMSELKKGSEGFYVHFPVKAALNRKIIEFVEHSPVPDSIEIPSYFKHEVTDKDGNVIELQIVDYKTWQRHSENDFQLVAEKLSPWGVWNDTYLIDYVVERWGEKSEK